mgnify:CR=1 FL=1
MKKLSAILLLLLVGFSPSGEVLASSARSVVETQVEGDQVEVYQSVETTVDGETVRKESNEPGKLELEMKKTGEGEPTVTFSQESTSVTTPTPTPTQKKSPVFFAQSIIEFFRNLFLGLTRLIGLPS